MFWLILFILVFYIAKQVNDFTKPYDIDEHLFEKDNIALAISFSGYLVGIFIIFIGSLIGPSKGFFKDVIDVSFYSIIGIFLLNFTRYINDKLILSNFCNISKITEESNIGVGAAQFGSYISAAILISGSIYNQSGYWFFVFIPFFLSQFVFVFFVYSYNKFIKYDIKAKIADGNHAVGVALAGVLISLSIIILSGIGYYQENFYTFLYYFIIYSFGGFISLPVFKFIINKLIAFSSNLYDEIANDVNIGAAILESCLLISFACLIFFIS